jgi:Glutathione-dependent formaldehyde-activating enzyme
MATRRASCSCGQLTVEVEGDPVRISICHCLACQRRTGSAFGMQARWLREQVRIEGEATEYMRISDEGEERSFFFLPALRRDSLLLDRPGADRGAGRGVRRSELPRAAHLGVGRPHAPVGRPARRDRAHRLSLDGSRPRLVSADTSRSRLINYAQLPDLRFTESRFAQPEDSSVARIGLPLPSCR